MLDPKVFKAYDVRGIYPDELDEEGAYAIGRAYVQQFEPRRIAVGRDMRLSSPQMAAAVIARRRRRGRRGARPRARRDGDGLFRGRRARLDGGIMVTASHNPKEYTGMKIVRRGALPVGGESGLLDVRDRALAVADRQGAAARSRMSKRTTSGPRTSIGCCRSSTCRRCGRCKVVIDAANGMAGAMLPPVLERLPVEAVRATSIRTARSRITSRTRCCRRTASSSSAKTLEEGADLGVAFDGDADRCFFVDDSGEFVPGDFATALLAESVLAKEPGAKIIYDVRASWAVPETIERRRRRAADQPRRPRVHQAPHAEGATRRSAARCRATTTSATSRRRTRASSRSC